MAVHHILPPLFNTSPHLPEHVVWIHPALHVGHQPGVGVVHTDPLDVLGQGQGAVGRVELMTQAQTSCVSHDVQNSSYCFDIEGWALEWARAP